MVSLRAVLLLCLGLQLSAPALAGTDARQWLARLSSAGDGFAYRGVLIHESGDHTETLRITHGAVDGRPYDHLEHLDGDRREVIRSGSSLTCVHPGQRLTRLLRNQKRGVAEAVENHYALALTGESRVAGRPVVLLEAMPLDSFRLGYRIAFDRETALPLRYELIDAGQRVVERFQFAELHISESLSPQWQVAEAGAVAGDVAEAQASPAPLPAPWSPQWLPPGFSPVAADGDDSDVQSYSDGLAMLSIFVAAAAEGDADSAGGSARQGATVAHTARLGRDEQTYVVTVIGEVPPVTAQRVADAVAWREPAP